jgi:hypothetical protein
LGGGVGNSGRGQKMEKGKWKLVSGDGGTVYVGWLGYGG